MKHNLLFYRSEKSQSAGTTLICPRVGDAGYDLQAATDAVLAAGERKLVDTGIHCAIPLGMVGIIRDRSSMAVKGGVCLAGIIDASYRGEVKVLLYNVSAEPLVIKAGDKIAQMLVVEHLPGEMGQEVDSLESLGETSRGSGGFGSTGK